METIKVYKLFRREADGLHPLFIDNTLALPIGKWIDAESPDIDKLEFGDDGYYLIKIKPNQIRAYLDVKPLQLMVLLASDVRYRFIELRTGKKVNRRFYDLGVGSNGQVLRFAHRPGWHSSATPTLPGVNMDGKVWAECLIPADDYYILHRNVSGLSKTHEPIDWYISQKLLINRVLE